MYTWGKKQQESEVAGKLEKNVNNALWIVCLVANFFFLLLKALTCLISLELHIAGLEGPSWSSQAEGFLCSYITEHKHS